MIHPLPCLLVLHTGDDDTIFFLPALMLLLDQLDNSVPLVRCLFLVGAMPATYTLGLKFAMHVQLARKVVTQR
jgi:hypothetical protein